MDVALGISPHTGWAVAVAVAGTADGASVVLRRQVELVGPSLPGAVYHAAAGEPAGAATALVRSVERSARHHATRAVAGLHHELTDDGHRLVAVAVCAKPHVVPDDVATVVANHTLMHTAEGELYREVLERAVGRVGVPLLQVRRKEVAAEAQRRLGLGEQRQQALLAALGDGLGPPWRIDHKQAALLAMVALADQAAVTRRGT